MTEKELRELDAWIAEHVMGWKKENRFDGDELLKKKGIKQPPYRWLSDKDQHYTTDPAAAMEVLKKCAQKEIRGTSFVCCQFSDGNNSTLSKNGHWSVGRLDRDGRWVSGEVHNALTLELAICLFAKKLFSK